MASQTAATERPTETVLRRWPGPAWLLLLRHLASRAARSAEADRGRAALLAAVSHDLRTPLAAAKAAVSGLRSLSSRLSADERDELLATAEQSLDQLTDLVTGLLDVTRLQAGSPAVFSRPADIGPIITSALDGRLTMVISLPAAPARPAAGIGGARRTRAA